jgi:hypothetical protein
MRINGFQAAAYGFGRWPAIRRSAMAIDLAGLWESGLLLFYLSIGLVIVLDVAAILAASSEERPERTDSAVPRADPVLTGT